MVDTMSTEEVTNESNEDDHHAPKLMIHTKYNHQQMSPNKPDQKANCQCLAQVNGIKKIFIFYPSIIQQRVWYTIVHKHTPPHSFFVL
jgi:hypothetical protein